MAAGMEKLQRRWNKADNIHVDKCLWKICPQAQWSFYIHQLISFALFSYILLFKKNFAWFSEYKKKIGFTGTLLIEPKPKEPSKHQYDYGI